MPKARLSGPVILLLSLIVALWPASACPSELSQGARFHIETRRWPEAEKLFRSDPHWLGGDGASSVDLKWGRVLWLFGDSFINERGTRSRQDAVVVRNSVAIQKGYLPSLARMSFAWKEGHGRPAAFFRSEGDTWFWPGSGVMVMDRLLIFLMKIRKAENGLGFQPCGWKAVLVANPEKNPSVWNLQFRNSPRKDDMIIGTGSPMVMNGFVHVFSTNWKNQKVYLARWPMDSAMKGDLSRPQWWTGAAAGWVAQTVSGPRPRNVISGGQTEFSVEYVPKLKRYLQVQTLSLLNPCLSVCTASALTGTWSARECFAVPPGQQGCFIYAGKSHPGIQGADMLFTYVMNTGSQKRLLSDMSLYFPVVLKGWIVMDGKEAPGTAMAMH